MTDYCAILESYIINSEDIAIESVANKLHDMAKNVKSRVRKLIEWLRSIWNKFTEFVRKFNANGKNKTTAQNNTSDDAYRTSVTAVENAGKMLGRKIVDVLYRSKGTFANCLSTANLMERKCESIGQGYDHRYITTRIDPSDAKLLEQLRAHKSMIVAELEKISIVDVEFYKSEVSKLLKHKDVLKSDFTLTLKDAFYSECRISEPDTRMRASIELMLERVSSPNLIAAISSPSDPINVAPSIVISALQAIINKYDQVVSSVMTATNTVEHA